MLRQICRRGRLMALIAQLDADELSQKTRAILGDERLQSEPRRSTPAVPPTRRAERVPADLYSQTLSYLGSHGIALRHHQDFPHPEEAQVLSPYGRFVTEIKAAWHDRTFSIRKSHPGNSSIVFSVPGSGKPSYGFIQSIWSHDVNDSEEIFFAVRCHLLLSPEDEEKSPYRRRPRLNATTVYSGAGGSEVIIRFSDIIAHAAYCLCEPGTFGIQQAILLLVNTDRGRSEIPYM
jgi:hypothetical protein